MSIASERICFGTLAYGLQFRVHAKLLAEDLLCWHPDIEFYVITDQPEYFRVLPNVRAIKYHPTGIRSCYHDKRQVIAAAIRHHDVCIYMDADCRIISAINFSEIMQDGIFFTAIYGENLNNKLASEIICEKNKNKLNGPMRRRKILSDIAQYKKIKFEDVIFVNEPFFVVNSNFGDVPNFLAIWDYCAAYTTARLFEFGEGASIGIALAKQKAVPCILNRNPLWLFKDVFCDVKAKPDLQLKKFQQLLALRQAISNDVWPTSKVRKALEIMYFAIRFYLKYFKCIR
ncbi:hypothetical protein [Cellvibrio sp. NN19]|uniref:hypothetical protein n=1 Tax=Cellvibrio chitinivorans TaxID=3102792 RepID=UPI002B40D3B2|nr:hypothetical protein [Cellvibrio sp. NN19]